MQFSILTEDERQANRIVKRFFKEIIPEINHLTNMFEAWQHHSVPPLGMFKLIKDEQQRIFLKLAEMMIETIGFKATLLLLTENFLEEQEKQPTIRRDDGLIDIPVR